jgi:multicomponent Na+:H+ antiporter subunit B
VVKKIFALLLLAGMGLILFNFARSMTRKKELSRTAKYYAENGPKQTGSANLVTAVVVTYRGLDTLGEVTILFVAASILGFALKNSRDVPLKSDRTKTSELLKTGATFLVPLIFLLGAYVFLNGHLSPGGGFQGGAIIASGTVLIFLSDPYKKSGKVVIRFVEALSGMAYVGIGIAGLIFAAGFLDNRILPLGKFGTIFSAGAIPLIYSIIGLKVGAELSAIVYKLKDAKE